MFGQNPIRAPESGDGDILKIQNIFLTLQGEGPYTGVPSIFIRLGGCNLACNFCDTEFEDFKELTLAEILTEIRAKIGSNSVSLAVITGGEPLRQPISRLCKVLIDQGFKVQMETNGTLARELPREVEIICSPKVSNSTYYPVRPDLMSYITAFKFLISANNSDYSDVPNWGFAKKIVYVQPMDEYDEIKNKANIELAIKIALKYNYRLSLQTHKYLGIE